MSETHSCLCTQIKHVNTFAPQPLLVQQLASALNKQILDQQQNATLGEMVPWSNLQLVASHRGHKRRPGLGLNLWRTNLMFPLTGWEGWCHWESADDYTLRTCGQINAGGRSADLASTLLTNLVWLTWQ